MLAPRSIGWVLLGFAATAGVLRWQRWFVPIFELPFLAGDLAGWVFLGCLALLGAGMAWRGGRAWQLSPLTLRQVRRFKSIRRGYVSFLILVGLVVLAAMDNLLAGNRALIVRHEGRFYFPFVRDEYPGRAFGLDYDSEANYRQLQQKFRREGKGDWVLMPPVPYGPKLDSSEIRESLIEKDGLVFRHGKDKPFDGRAFSVFKDKPEQQRQEWTFRRGLRHGEIRGWDIHGEQVEKGRFEQGRRVSYEDLSDGRAAALESQAAPGLQTILYPPSPPSWEHKHFLGTTSSGGDVLAVLFGGLQQAIIASVLFVAFVFVMGVTIGCILGYFGGAVDLIGQRLMEVWSNMPFLFLVIIISSIVSPTLVLLVGIIALFSWMGPTIYLRTATYKEKERDYVAAARLSGAGPGRVIFHHILPNTVSILVTLIPFEVVGIITAIAALDFLGFGLPPDEPSWGRLLHEGTENFNYPWIVSSAFVAMVIVLVLVTFVGEAIREAFDPKKFTTYQ